MFIDVRIHLLSRAFVVVTVLDVELGIFLADPDGFGGFTLLGPKFQLLGVMCYLALGARLGPLLSQAGKSERNS